MQLNVLKKDRFTKILLGVFIVLQIPLWLGTGSIFSLLYTYYQQYRIMEENQGLRTTNQILADKIAALKNGNSEIEARARLELGLVKQNETYYQVIYHKPKGSFW
jgi:cell division protein FtsB